jgi:putative SOS response-associated peptidase YedK
MCGRFTLYSSIDQIKKAFAVDVAAGGSEEAKANHNIAPGDEIFAVIRQAEKRMGKLHWGLVPPWSQNTAGAAKLINARVETLHEKPSFKNAFQKKRCLIPANGFYERKEKQLWYCTPATGEILGFAGIWEMWKGRDGAAYHSCAIITAEAGEAMRFIHDRMPLILKPEAFDEWLNPAIHEFSDLNRILKAGRELKVQSHPVSKYGDTHGL